MKIILKENLNRKSMLAVIGIIAVVSSFLSALVGDALVTLSGAALAVVFLLDTSRWRLWSVGWSAVIAAINIALNIYYGALLSVYSLLTVLVAVVISISFSLNASKATCSAIITVLFSSFLLVGVYLYGAAEAGSYDPAEVIEFYSAYISALKDTISAEMSAVTEQYSAELGTVGLTDEEYLDTLILAIRNSAVGILIVIGFALSGITLKLFSAFASALSDYPSPLFKWRFITGNLFAYLYIVLFFLSAFLGSSTDAFAITVSTLNTVYMFVYAYLGFGVARAIVARRFSGALSFILLIVLMVMLSSFAIQALSLLGVFTTIKFNKARSNTTRDGKDGNP